MFDVSDEAKQLIYATLEHELEGRPELKKGHPRPSLRLSFRRGCAGLSLALSKPEDKVIDFSGYPLIVVGPGDFGRVDGTRLIVEHSGGRAGLTIEPIVSSLVSDGVHAASRSHTRQSG